MIFTESCDVHLPRVSYRNPESSICMNLISPQSQPQVIFYNISMSKIKPQYGIEQELLCMIYRLIEKKLSKIFREPVDAALLPDYYQKIKKPVDLSTVIKNLRTGKYTQATEIRDDLNQMMINCRIFNVHIDILRTAEKFENSIKTEWTNLQKILKQKDIRIDTPIEVTEQTLKNFDAIEEKNNNRKPSNLQTVLGELEISNKKSVPEYRILPPIPAELIQNDKGDNELPKHLNYQPMKYLVLKPQDKQKLLRFQLVRDNLSKVFEEVAVKKLAKYKKILYNKVMWIQSKIVKKCLERKRFRKMSTPQYLSTYIQNGEIASNLQLRKLQMYVKMVAYWVEEYPTILSYSMKNKFIDACRAIKRSIFRVLRYRKMPRSTKINLDLNEEPIREDINNDFKEELLGQDESRRYDNQIKSFKRMLSKDQGETIKKYTKIQIKNQNGEFTVVDWNLENNDKKKTSRNVNISRTQENTEEALRIEKEKRRKEEREQDEQFLNNFRSKSNRELISTYHELAWIDWDQIRQRKLPKVLQLTVNPMVFV